MLSDEENVFGAISCAGLIEKRSQSKEIDTTYLATRKKIGTDETKRKSVDKTNLERIAEKATVASKADFVEGTRQSVRNFAHDRRHGFRPKYSIEKLIAFISQKSPCTRSTKMKTTLEIPPSSFGIRHQVRHGYGAHWRK